MMKPRHRQVTGLAQGHRARKWQVRLWNEAAWAHILTPTSVSIPLSESDKAVFLQGASLTSVAQKSDGLGFWFQVFNDHMYDLGKHYFSSLSVHIPIRKMGDNNRFYPQVGVGRLVHISVARLGSALLCRGQSLHLLTMASSLRDQHLSAQLGGLDLPMTRMGVGG